MSNTVNIYFIDLSMDEGGTAKKVYIFWIIIWFVVLVISSLITYKSLKIEKRLSLPTKTSILIVFCSIGKILNIGLSFYETSNKVEIGILSFIRNSPSFLLLSSFLIVVLFWIQMYHDPVTYQNRRSCCSFIIKPLYVLIVTVQIAFVVLLSIAEAKFSSMHIYYKSVYFFSRLYTIVMSISFSIAFLVYGFLVGKKQQIQSTRIFYSSAIILGLTFLANGIHVFTISFLVPIVTFKQIMVVTSIDNIIDIFISLEIVILVYLDAKAKKKFLMDNSSSSSSTSSMDSEIG
ncbi:hypothetical protein DLAC_04777 [Tieghemostelium lacteum]|uniref:THH1/TOM1/TOM3 domain-containing protein n=1 Tax=Tieghemostelium lacteum TaxID=361077 RepID=A0A151ZKP0_TIELA|nr:hypothetical protein DLAC_04777 [Tieghemostelium lacteum]|eukprot:KYQ94477.1 hypothetical protein DLAC_04777 [Tieghemostelium lacteum]